MFGMLCASGRSWRNNNNEKRAIILLTFCIVYSMSLIHITTADGTREQKMKREIRRKFYQQCRHLTRANIRKNKCTATWAKWKAHAARLSAHRWKSNDKKKKWRSTSECFFWMAFHSLSCSLFFLRHLQRHGKPRGRERHGPYVDGGAECFSNIFYLLLKVIKLQLQSILNFGAYAHTNGNRSTCVRSTIDIQTHAHTHTRTPTLPQSHVCQHHNANGKLKLISINHISRINKYIFRCWHLVRQRGGEGERENGRDGGRMRGQLNFGRWHFRLIKSFRFRLHFLFGIHLASSLYASFHLFIGKMKKKKKERNINFIVPFRLLLREFIVRCTGNLCMRGCAGVRWVAMMAA